MTDATPEALFARYRSTGDVQALAAVFDLLAPELLLVAAHLARGGAAEDLVQATFLDAMRHADRWDPTRPLAPWLVGMLGNHLRELRRQQQRVPDAARLESRVQAPPDAVAEANESLAAVHAAVERLPRHYRQVMSLRLVHGLELQQIAHSLGVPLGTVKVRLHRGTALLRRALPAGLAPALAVLLSPGRGLAAARDAVLGQAAATTGVAAAAGLLVGGFVMKKVVLGAIVAAVLVGTWQAFDESGASAPVVPTQASAAPAVAAAGVPPAVVPAPVPAAAAAPAAATASPVVREAAPTTGSLAVHVTWAPDGAPAPSLEVRAMRHGVRDPGTKRATDARGFATFSDLTPGEYLLLLPGGPRGTNAEVVVGETRTVELAADAQRLRVLVVGADGQPLPGAGVWCRHPNVERGSPPGVLAGTTDGAGAFAYRGLPLGSVWARKAGLQPSVAVSLRSPRGEIQSEPVDVKLELGPAGCSVLGSVVDPDGRAVAEARVLIACEDTFGSGSKREFLETRTDASGRFASAEVPVGERYIAAEAAGFAPACERVATAVEQPAAIVLALRVGASISGRVTDAGGQPVVGVDLTALHRRSLPGLGSWGVWRTAHTDDDGRYRINAILPGEIEARAAVQPEVTQEFTLADREQRTWDVSRPPERAIHGTVLDPEGKPLARWTLRVMAPTRARGSRPNLAMSMTDPRGAFRLAGLEDHPYRVFVFAPTEGGPRAGAAAMVPRAVMENVRPSADALAVRIDAAAMGAGWIEGSIAMPDGVQARIELSLYAKALRGGGFTVPQERLEPGQTTFRIGPLPAGEYDLLCDIEGRGRLAQNGLQLRVDETLRLPPFAAAAQRPLEVVLKHDDGRPATGATVKLVTLEPFTEVAPGRYRSQPIAAGAYDVRVRGAGFAPDTFPVQFAGAPAAFEHTVAPAATVEVCCKPATPRERWIGALHVELSDASGTEIVKELTQIDGKQDFTWSIGLRPGTYSLRCSEFGGGSGSTTLTVGTAPLRVELQLAK